MSNGSSAPQCQALTDKGRGPRCTRDALPGQPFCRQHRHRKPPPSRLWRLGERISHHWILVSVVSIVTIVAAYSSCESDREQGRVLEKVEDFVDRVSELGVARSALEEGVEELDEAYPRGYVAFFSDGGAAPVLMLRRPGSLLPLDLGETEFVEADEGGFTVRLPPVNMRGRRLPGNVVIFNRTPGPSRVYPYGVFDENDERVWGIHAYVVFATKSAYMFALGVVGGEKSLGTRPGITRR